MKIVRIETLEIMPGEDITGDEIKDLINKTQDLKVLTWERLPQVEAYSFVVERELEWFPDTIK